MSTETHSQIASFIWSICNLLRGPYKRNEYRKVILPLTVLRRFDCILAPTKAAVLKENAALAGKPENIIRHKLCQITESPFYNLSKFTFDGLPKDQGFNGLLDDANQLAPNLNNYINGFSPNVRAIMERFDFGAQIARMAEKDLLYLVVKQFATMDLSPQRVDNVQMGYVFEELIRIGAEQSNEEAGEHFTPREVIKLMVNLLLSPEQDLRRSHVVKTIYDPACGTGGMLSVAEKYIHDLNADAQPKLFGQDWNDEAWAVCKSDMLIKGEDAENIILGDTFTKDGFDRQADGSPWTFDYMLANPPFGVEWKQQQRHIEKERDELGYGGRFGAGTPRVNDGALLFLQHMLSKMRAPQDGGSRLAIVFNGSPLFTGDAGGGESSIRQWIIENDWLEAVVALPEQLFYNTGISTYLWVLTNRKEKMRKGKVQLIDARAFWVQMEKSLGNKRRRIGDPSDKAKDPDHIGEITRIFGDFRDGETRSFPEEDAITHQTIQRQRVVSKVFDNEDFGYRKITVERPLRLNFQATAERIARLEDESGFKNLADSKKKDPAIRQQEIEAGQRRQEEIRAFLYSVSSPTVREGLSGEEKALADARATDTAATVREGLAVEDKALADARATDTGASPLYKDREAFLADLKAAAKQKDIRLSASELKAVLAALSERDETADICRDAKGHPEPDPELRDTETVPLKESIEDYFEREVLPHVPDAWIDHSKTKIGYEIPLNRHFYRYEPPRPLEVIESDIKQLETEILELLKEVTA